MKKSIIYLVVINVIRFLLLYFGTGKFFNFQIDKSNAYFGSLLSSIFQQSGSHYIQNFHWLVLINTLLLVIFQISFFILSSNILRSDRKYLLWITLITSIMLNPLSISSTLDNSLLILWTFSLHFLYQAIFKNKKLHWILAGIFIGVAFNCRQIAAALPIGLFLFLVFSTRYRYHINTVWPYLSLIIAFIFSLPYVFGTLNFLPGFLLVHAKHNAVISGLAPHYFLELISSQLIILLPVLFVGLWWILFKYLGRIMNKPNQVNAELWFLLCFFIPMFLGIYIISFFNKIEINQLMPVYISGIIVLGKMIKLRWFKWHIISNLVLQVILAILMLNGF